MTLVNEIYTDLSTIMFDLKYLMSRDILASQKEQADEINGTILHKQALQIKMYLSAKFEVSVNDCAIENDILVISELLNISKSSLLSKQSHRSTIGNITDDGRLRDIEQKGKING
ncbi:hypothetical protein MA16_Dca002827 [Dendrobium catenatum]|uniref:Uncharacterized protein n=1 Tax=Dendrobium catenatum TaxID=906689 RepID=A0A2I0X8U7_9ASPA|nr:hypothetical protein MA16_Dca002827 [Dendrobium catenatum]